VSIKLHVKNYEWRGPFVSRLVDEAGEEGVISAAESILLDAAPYVPYEDGDLLDSGRAGQDRDNLGRFTNGAFVSYDTPYAVKRHEHPEFQFKGSGQGKWLEHAMQRRASRIMQENLMPPLATVFRLP
jgi:hypothetical protein